MVVITDLGIIKGGVCEGIFKMRKERERGGEMCWEDAIREKCVSYKNGWYRMKKKPKFRGWGEYGAANYEIGAFRMLDDVFPIIIKNKQSFRLKWMKLWIKDIASFEFAISGKTPFQIDRAGYVKPHQDFIYKKWELT